MENKDRAEVEKKKVYFYGLGSDGSLIFEDGEPIRVNRGVLAFHSPFIRDKFFGPEPKTEIKILGYDRTTFKLFLDCLLGLKEYTLLDAFVIYPIAKDYKVTESQIKCVAALKPEVMDENVPLVLNLSVFYEDNYLTDYVLDFIETKCGIINFLENEKYFGSLDPSAMCKLIEKVDLNSVIWTLVYQWEEKYLNDRNISDVKSFFLVNGILDKISLSHFESVAALFNFHEKSKMQFFSNEEVFRLVKTNMLKDPKIIPDKSEWVKIDAGYEFKEVIVFKHNFNVYSKELLDGYPNHDFDIVIRPNPILIGSKRVSGSTELKIKARYIFRNISRQRSQDPAPKWRNDLNFFHWEEFRRNPSKNFEISDLISSNEFDVNLTDDAKEPVYKFLIKSLRDHTEFHAVEVTYKFNSSCRILKTSLDLRKYSVDEDNLYFTKNVTIVEKVNEN